LFVLLVRAGLWIEQTRAPSVLAAEHAEGCAASYPGALAAADPHADAEMFPLGGQPGMGTEEICRVASSWRAEGDDIVVPTCHGTPGPLIFSWRILPELAVLHDDKSTWKLLDRHADLVRPVELDRPLPADIDTLANYAALAQNEA
jgi:CTP:molybdopterin cytidylyltransferase MocA